MTQDTRRGASSGLSRLSCACTTAMTRTSDTVSVLGFVWKHPPNRGNRICAVSRAIQSQLSGRFLHRRTVARLGEHSSLCVDLHRTGASKVVYGNPPDYPEMLVWQQALQSGDLFVDVGALMWAAIRFGLRISAQKSSPWSRPWQNEIYPVPVKHGPWGPGGEIPRATWRVKTCT